jgi:micrococcal nuclease
MLKRFITLVLMLAIAPIGSAPAWADDLYGVGKSVIDGDEFVFCAGEACANIRLCGIDTPSNGKPGYKETITALESLVLEKKVACLPLGDGSVCDDFRGSDNRGRTIAQCFVEEATVDVAGALVAAHHACDRTRDSGGYYSKDHPDWRCAKFGEFEVTP